MHYLESMQSLKNSERRAVVMPTVSQILGTGELLELVYERIARRTQFAIGKGSEIRLVDDYVLPNGIRLVPYSPNNNLIRHEVLLLAERPEAYGSVLELASRIDAYLQRYVDLSDDFRTLVIYYVFLTWVYDAFNELPYLRFRGEYGSGKTRALFVIGSVCNKAFFASGASTVSPIFHTLDAFRGTLLFDEADFRFSDEKAELVKILNNGTVRGFPVLRTHVSPKKEFEPRAFAVFGPKLVAMRRSYEDDALESRFFTEEMGRGTLRSDIPINLPDIQREEALVLRNQLLGYRFNVLSKLKPNPSLIDRTLSPRLNQILVPLLSIVEDEDARARIRAKVLAMNQLASAGQEVSIERRLLLVLTGLFRDPETQSVSVGGITATLIERFGDESRRPFTSRYVGELLRERLGVTAYKSHGVFVVPGSERSRITNLCVRYGIALPIKENEESLG
jgi:hypothetical protein